MSTMRWTYKSQATGNALVDGQRFKKGQSIPIQVYELELDSRGGTSSTTEVYYYGTSPVSEKGVTPPPTLVRPDGQELFLGKDFEIVEKKPSKSEKKLLSNNKTVMWLGIIVAGYFAYKYFTNK